VGVAAQQQHTNWLTSADPNLNVPLRTDDAPVVVARLLLPVGQIQRRDARIHGPSLPVSAARVDLYTQKVRRTTGNTAKFPPWPQTSRPGPARKIKTRSVDRSQDMTERYNECCRIVRVRSASCMAVRIRRPSPAPVLLVAETLISLAMPTPTACAR